MSFLSRSLSLSISHKHIRTFCFSILHFSFILFSYTGCLVGIEFTAWVSFSPWPIDGHYTFFTSFYVYMYIHRENILGQREKVPKKATNMYLIFIGIWPSASFKWKCRFMCVRMDGCMRVCSRACICVDLDIYTLNAEEWKKCWSDLCCSFVWIIISCCLTTQSHPFYWSV